MVTSPAPARNPARAASRAAPVLPADPAITSRCPALPLCAARPRLGNMAATVSVSTQWQRGPWAAASASTLSGAIPRSTTSTLPTGASASRTSPSLRAPMVAVMCAFTTLPRISPVSASRPDGMSTATRKASVVFIPAIAAAGTPVTSERRPVPNKASTMTAAPRRRSCQTAGSLSPDRSTIVSGLRRRKTLANPAASPVILAGGNAKRTFTSAPRRKRWRATTKPSPPFCPAPHTMRTSNPATRGRSRTMISATPRPAFSMSTRPGSPSFSMIASSTARIWAAVSKSAMTPYSTRDAPGANPGRWPCACRARRAPSRPAPRAQ